MTSFNPDRVLSVQSHVSFGYVGGKAAVFPLQCLGYDVDVINTVNFSNHSGYRRRGGSVTTATELSDIFNVMKQNGFLVAGRLLTGYIPGSEALKIVQKFAAELRDQNPGAVYLLDPVMGDAGRLYVGADVIPVYKNMLPLATIITPNWFEVETLTGVPLTDFASLREALRILHTEYRVPHVVISSIPYNSWLADCLPSAAQSLPSSMAENGVEDPQDLLACICSTVSPANAEDPSTVFARCVPLIPGYFSGVGDLFSALVLGHYKPGTTDNAAGALAYATSAALSTTHAVLARTQKYYLSLPDNERNETDPELDGADPERRVIRQRGRELRLIQSQDLIRAPDAGVGPQAAMVPWSGFWTTS